jgi:hypothetical protein
MPPKRKAAARGGARSAKKQVAPRAGSIEEVQSLLNLQITLHEATERSPDSTTLEKQARENIVLLRRSVHTWGEKTVALTTRPAALPELNDQQELCIIRAQHALAAQIEAASAYPNQSGPPVELLKMEGVEMKELQKQAEHISKLFIEPEEAFLTKRPLWKPENALVLDDRDESTLDFPIA